MRSQTNDQRIYLWQLADQYHNYRIILILDKAGWHISQSLQIADNIKMLHLNPYSPEHNPVELLERNQEKIFSQPNIQKSG